MGVIFTDLDGRPLHDLVLHPVGDLVDVANLALAARSREVADRWLAGEISDDELLNLTDDELLGRATKLTDA